MSKKTIIIINLGSPEDLSKRAIRAFLSAFLSDKRVVDLPRILWLPLLYGIILPFRPAKLIPQYKAIWTEAGSPLICDTLALAGLMQKYSNGVEVKAAMRYGSQNIKKVVQGCIKAGATEFVFLPLYPQYNISTTGSVDANIKSAMKKYKHPFVVIQQYAVNHDYIRALVETIKAHWETNGRAEMLVFSFHGVPVKMIEAGDPYLQHCKQTVDEIVSTLALSDQEYKLVFQSRFGKAKWLEPYCDKTLASLAERGVKSVDVLCPGFSVDCLETLFEIHIENRRLFESAGGETFRYIPALGPCELHARALLRIAEGAHID